MSLLQTNIAPLLTKTTENTLRDKPSGFKMCEFKNSKELKLSLKNNVENKVELKKEGFIIDGKPTLLRGGPIQWFKIPKDVWEDRIKRFKAAGYNTIDMYVSWRNHEPIEGKFDFEKFDLKHFLDLAKKHNMYVMFRPGPYICNEMDAGGLPGWLIAKANKASDEKNGVNVRTDDKEFLDIVKRYFSKVNEIVKPYLHTNGGPIILYSVENEYDWFLVLKDFDKFSTKAGKVERPINQKINVGNYLEKLTGFARGDGINVPITTCPGSGKINGLDNAKDLVPMPNMYTGLKNAEFQTKKLREDMHSEKYNGQYKNVPLGLTETERESNVLRRLILGGMNSVIQFNNLGFFQQDHQNAVLINGFLTDNIQGVAKFLSRMVNFKHPRTAFLRPSIGMYPGKGDYFGSAISPSGVLRDSFYNIRRTNLFLESFEHIIAKAYKPNRTFDNAKILDQDQSVRIKNKNTGVKDPDHPNTRVNYWLPTGENSALIGIYNNGRQSRDLGKNSITAFGETFPKYSNLNIPKEHGLNTSSCLNEVDNEYTKFIPYNFPLKNDVTLKYSTSEVLTNREFNDENLLVLYGEKNSHGELKLEGKDIKITSKTNGIVVNEDTDNSFTISYKHSLPKALEYTDENGKKGKVIILDTHTAGKTWFANAKQGEAMVCGVDYLNRQDDKNYIEISSNSQSEYFCTYSRGEISLDGTTTIKPYDEKSGLTIMQPKKDIPEIPFNLNLTTGKVMDDVLEADPLYCTDKWLSIGDKPSHVENHGIYHGHSWYRAEVNLTKDDLAKTPNLLIGSAADFSSIYINGHYITTLTPIGTEINNKSKDSSYKFNIPTQILKEGKNILSFKTEIWGHGGILLPHGTLNRISAFGKSFEIPFIKFRIPSLSYDSKKGLSGDSVFNNKPIVNWKLKPNLSGFEKDYHKPNFNDEKWEVNNVPLKLKNGEVRWYRTEFNGNNLPDKDKLFVPISLNIKGKNAKASIYLNGRLMGRWLSDDDWLKRGGWFQPTRKMWTFSSVDEFPIAREGLKKGRNVISIAFEDASDINEKGSSGIINEINLKTATEGMELEKQGVKGKEVTYKRIELK